MKTLLDPRLRIGLTLALLALVVLAAIGPYLSKEYLEPLFTHTSYYLTAGLFIAASYFLVKSIHQHRSVLLPFLRGHISIVIAAMLLVLCTTKLSPWGYKVLSDETNLISISQSLAQHKTPMITTEGLAYYGSFHIKDQVIPKRPLAYPFAVSLLHSLAGYDYRNAFVLNGLILLIILLIPALFVAQRYGRKAGLSTLFIFVSSPGIIWCATSAGFETMNAALLITLLYLVYELLRKPREELAQLYWVLGLMFSLTRYESPLIFGVCTLVLISRERQWGIDFVKRNLILLSATLLCLLPSLWEIMLSKGSYIEEGDQLFIAAAFVKHIQELAKGLFTYGTLSPYAPAVSALALLSLVSLWHHRKSMQKANLIVCYLVAGLSLVYLVMFCSHYFGHAMHASSYRYFLPIVMTSSIAATLFVVQWPRFQSLVLCSAFFIAMFQLPYASTQDLPKTQTLVRSTAHIYDFLDRHADSRTLLVVQRPGLYTVREQSAISFPTWQRRRDIYEQYLQTGLLSQILVVQEHRYDQDKPDQKPPSGIQLTEIESFQNGGEFKVVISRASKKFAEKDQQNSHL